VTLNKGQQSFCKKSATNITRLSHDEMKSQMLWRRAAKLEQSQKWVRKYLNQVT